MKTVLLIFLGLLILQSKWFAYCNFLSIGCCWGGNPVPLQIKVIPFIKSVIFSLILEALFTGILIGFNLEILTIMWLVELTADVLFVIWHWIVEIYYRVWDFFRDFE